MGIKIPVYRSEAMPTTATGMRSWRTRVDSTPFIQKIKAENDLVNAFTGTIAEALALKGKSERETAAAQALLAAEVSMQQTVAQLENSKTPWNVMSEDVTQPDNWMGAVNDIKETARAELGAGARKIFDIKFGTLQARYTASMQEKNTKRLNKYEVDQFEIGALTMEADFGTADTSNVNIPLYNQKMAELVTKGDALIITGKADASDIAQRLLEVQENTAENALTFFINESASPVSTALTLANALTGDEAAPEQLQAIMQMPGGEYALHLLRQVKDKSKRAEIVDDLVDQSFNLFDSQNKLQNQIEKAADKKKAADYNSIFSPNTDPNERKRIYNSLDAVNYMTPQMRKVADEFLSGALTFSENDDGQTILDLEDKVAKSRLTSADVVAAAGKLTQSTFQSYMGDVGQIRSRGVTDALGDARIAFRYEEERGTDIEPYEIASMTAYYNAQRKLRQFERDNPGASGQQIRAEAQAIIAEERKGLKGIIEIELIDLLGTLEERTMGLVFQPGPNGQRFNYATIVEEMKAFLDNNENGRLEANLQEINYYLQMMASFGNE